MNNIVTMAEHIVLKHLPKLARPIPLYGRIIGGRIGVWSTEENVYLEPVGIATPFLLPPDKESQVPLILEIENHLQVRAMVLNADGTRSEATIESIASERALQARHRGLLENGQLRGKSVKFVGCGSVTAKMARPIVEAGVGHVGFADGENFAPENVGRHCLSVDAIGLPKAVALADQMRLVNPELNTSVLTVPFTTETIDKYRQFLRGSSLVVIATDSVEVNAMVQDLCLQLGGIPAVIVGCWERAFAGEVIYSNPKRGTPCYGCVRNVLPGPAKGRNRPAFGASPCCAIGIG
jgi:molybdopterin/thiamine biosynthesis adenylyltransferase